MKDKSLTKRITEDMYIGTCAECGDDIYEDHDAVYFEQTDGTFLCEDCYKDRVHIV